MKGSPDPKSLPSGGRGERSADGTSVFGLRKWMIKALIQRGMSALPWSHKWNELFQRYVTGGLELSPNLFRIKLDQCAKHLEFYRALSGQPREAFTVLELGTGWFPVLPVGLYLAGAGRVVTYDINPLLSAHTLRQVVRYYCELHDSGELARKLPGLRPERVSQLREYLSAGHSESPAQFLKKLDIQVLIGDARRTGLSANSIDLVCSCTVLEHILYPDLIALFSEFRRISTPGSIMSHFIGLEDQYATFDPSISRFNFLRYTEREFRRWNNQIIPLNRLRIGDHRRAFREGGFEILQEQNSRGELAELQRIQLAPEFQHHPMEDLLVTFSWLVGRPRAASR